MILEGIVKISNSGLAKIKVGKKIYSIPKIYLLEKELHHGKSCSFNFENNKITDLKVEGKSISIDEGVLEEKAKKEKEKLVRVERKEAEIQLAKQTQRVLADDIFNPMESLLPDDTRSSTIVNASFTNFGLKLNKYAYYSDKDNKFQLSFNGKSMKANFANIPVADIAEKHKEQVESCYPNSVSWHMKVKDKLAIGLGEASVYETNICLHPIYGIPYIPGSAIKGMLRNFLIESNTEEDSIALPGMEAKAFSAGNSSGKQLCDIFGAPKSFQYKENDRTIVLDTFYKKDKQGDIVFADAYPLALEKNTIETDVMTPHFGKYYEGKSAPVDTLDPNPIPFFVSKEITFQLVLASRASNEDLLTFTQIELTKALESFGIGAKTAVGYGYFEVC